MPSLKEVKQQVADLKYADTFGTKKEIKYLPEILKDDEKILGLTSGLMDNNTWLIAFTHKRVIFLDKGMIYGLKQIEIPLRKINSIEHKTGIMFGEIHIWDGAAPMPIKNVFKGSVVPFVNALNDAIDNMNAAQNNNGGSAPASLSDELEKLAKLKDSGVLTSDEFDAQKQKLLAS